MRPFILLTLATLFVLPAALRAQEEDEATAKLRDTLRKTMLQVRDLQGQIATFQAQKIQDDAKIADLDGKLTKLTKQSAADKTAADRTIAALQQDNAAKDTRNAKQLEAIAGWKKSYESLLAKAKEIDAQRAELAQQKILADRKIADLRAKNKALYDLGKQILHRYERYGLGDAILAREPFIGVSKVNFENYIQDNSDKLDDNKAPQVDPAPSPAKKP